MQNDITWKIKVLDISCLGFTYFSDLQEMFKSVFFITIYFFLNQRVSRLKFRLTENVTSS